MAENGKKKYDPRRELLRALMYRVQQDQYPSVAMLDIIEELLEPDEVPAYVEMMLGRVRAETYPSLQMIRRVKQLL